MQLSRLLFALIWVVTLSHAVPIPAGGPSDTTAPVEDNSYKAWKDHKSGMQAGKTYVFTALTPLTEAAKIDGDKDLQDARNGIGGDHIYLVTVQVTSSESGPTKKRVTTLKADARYWDMYVKKGGNNVEMHEFQTWSTTYATDKDVKYTYKKELKTTTAKITTASKAYKAAHGTYDAKTNNCKTYVDAVLAAA